MMYLVCISGGHRCWKRFSVRWPTEVDLRLMELISWHVSLFKFNSVWISSPHVPNCWFHVHVCVGPWVLGPNSLFTCYQPKSPATPPVPCCISLSDLAHKPICFTSWGTSCTGHAPPSELIPFMCFCLVL